MKRILTFFKLDMALSLRDSVLIYSLISPIILAVILRFVLPSVQEVSLSFAVDSGIDTAVVQLLENYGNVEIYTGRESLIERVNRNDDVPGLILADDGYEIILEGNEGTDAGPGFAAVLRDVTSDLGGVTFTTVDFRGRPTPVREYAAVMMVMLSLFVGGIMVGFNIVDEKETKALRALAVSPLRMFEYILARSILALIIALVSGFSSALIILGPGARYGMLLAGILVSLVVSLPFGFIIGSFADNQMTAFALAKLLMAVFLTIPLVSIFISSSWQWVFYIFPNYWMFLSLSSVLTGEAHFRFCLSAPVTVAAGLLMTGLLVPRMRKGLTLR